jgi:hypothetical protein
MKMEFATAPRNGYPNFEKDSCYREFRQKSFSPKQIPWEPWEIKDIKNLSRK